MLKMPSLLTTQFGIDTYYSALSSYLSRFNWTLRPYISSIYSHSPNVRSIYNFDYEIGKIERIYDQFSQSLNLVHISTSIHNNTRLKGLGLVDKIYSFESNLALTSPISKIIVEPVNPIILSKLYKYFSSYVWTKASHNIVIHLNIKRNH